MKYNPTDTRTWAVEDNPSVKITKKDVRELSNSELLSIIISSGFVPMDKEAKVLLAEANNDLNTLSGMSYQKLILIPGIGPKRAPKILAAFEIGRRATKPSPEKTPIKSSASIFNIFRPTLSDLNYEEFWIVTLNRANKILNKIRISQGGLAGTVIDTRIIMKKCIEDQASAFICVHNHPSGNIHPSDADYKITEKLKKAGKLMEIELLDHVIIADTNYYSFADNGLII